MTISPGGRARLREASTPSIVLGSLLLALGLTNVGDMQAQAQRPNPRTRAPLVLEHDAAELRVLDWALWNVARYYVEPERIDPQAMTLAALEAMERHVPEVLVQPLDSGKRVRVRVGTAEQEFQVGDVEALWAVGPHVREVFRFVVENAALSEDTKNETEYAVVGGVLSTLDPHTTLLLPDDFEDMKASTKGSFGGLGIEVGMRNDLITVLRVLDGTPAAEVGMEAGDRIVQIDGESTVSLTLDDAVERMRGAPGTTVSVHVMRDGVDKAKLFQVTRAVIKLESVLGEVVPGTDASGKPTSVGVLRIPRNFAQTTGKELRDKLAQFQKVGVRGVVLDLRGNPGGLYNAAVEVADAFVSAGMIVATVGGGSNQREESKADDRYDFPNLPVVVLVDEGSASASEIVAGALRNLDRAVLVGRRTFGKGSVQVLHDRKVGQKEVALKLTIGQYLTPGDVSIQSVGVSPDLETFPVWVHKEHLQFFGRDRFNFLREEALESHLVSETARQQQSVAGPLYFLDPDSVGTDFNKGDKKAKEKTTDVAQTRIKALLADPEIRIARDLVLWAPSPERAKILARIDEFVRKQAFDEQENIRKSLAARGIDWSEGSTPIATKVARLKAAIRSDKPGNVIKGGETGTLTVAVTNEGSAPAYQVRAITDSDNRFLDERELLFGRIDPGQTRTYDLKLNVNERELSRTDRIELEFFEQHGAQLTTSTDKFIDLSVEGLPRPQFAYGYQILDDPNGRDDVEGNADGMLQVGERVRLRVNVKNIGEGVALDTWVNVRNLAGDALFMHTARENLKQMKPGESRVVDFDVELRSAPPTGAMKLQLTVSDNTITEFVSEKLSFSIDEPVVFSKPANATVTAPREIDLYASPHTPDRVIARSHARASFSVLGQTKDWVRVDLGQGRFAFASSSQTEPGGRIAGKPAVTEVLAVSPPRITLVGAITQTEDAQVHLSGVATDDEAVRDVYVTVYNPSRNIFGNSEKVFYQAARDPSTGKLEFAADVPLTPGNNLIEIHAREDDDVIATKRMWVLRTSGLAEARLTENKIKSSGRLRVDTFK